VKEEGSKRLIDAQQALREADTGYGERERGEEDGGMLCFAVSDQVCRCADHSMQVYQLQTQMQQVQQ